MFWFNITLSLLFPLSKQSQRAPVLKSLNSDISLYGLSSGIVNAVVHSVSWGMKCHGVNVVLHKIVISHSLHCMPGVPLVMVFRRSVSMGFASK